LVFDLPRTSDDSASAAKRAADRDRTGIIGLEETTKWIRVKPD
jgi:hypothetical protein